MSQFYVNVINSGPIPPQIATSYVTDSGTAIAAANILNVVTPGGGTEGIKTLGSGNTITVELTGTTIVYVAVTHNGVNPSPYVVQPLDTFISCDTTSITPGLISIELPNSTTLNREVTIKDRTGAASTNNILLTTVGGIVNIDGETTYILNGNFDSATVIWNGLSWEVY